MNSPLAVPLLLFLGAGCIEPDYKAGSTLRCAASGECPPDLRCYQGHCLRRPPDASPAQPDADELDAIDAETFGAEKVDAVAPPADTGPLNVPMPPDAHPDADAPYKPDAPACASACTPGANQCGPTGGLQTCEKHPGSGCLDWSAEKACPGGKVCQRSQANAVCDCPSPPPGCQRGAGTSCKDPTTLESCAVGADGCLEVKPATQCPSQKPCTGSFPEASCSCPQAPSACAGGPGAGCDGQNLVTCTRDSYGCLSISASGPCPAGKMCTGAAPGASCTCPPVPSGCESGPGTSCGALGRLVTCTMSGGCLTATSTPCLAGRMCTVPFPNATCTCPPPPADCAFGAGTACKTSTLLITCGTDANGCPAITGMTMCAGAKTCSGNAPSAGCVCPSPPSDCSGTGMTCRPGNSLASCGYDVAGCLTTLSTTTCTSPKACSGNFPSADCVCPAVPAECSMGVGRSCPTGSKVATCTEDPTTHCLLGSSMNCPGGTVCNGSFPGSQCVSDIPLGSPSPFPSSVAAPVGAIGGVQIQTSVAVLLTKFGVIMKSPLPAGARVTFALYSDGGDKPANLLASSPDRTLVLGTEGRNEFGVLSPPSSVVLQANTKYWIMAAYSSSMDNWLGQAATGTTVFRSASYPWGQPLPNPIGSTFGTNTAPINYYVIGKVQ